MVDLDIFEHSLRGAGRSLQRAGGDAAAQSGPDFSMIACILLDLPSSPIGPMRVLGVVTHDSIRPSRVPP